MGPHGNRRDPLHVNWINSLRNTFLGALMDREKEEETEDEEYNREEKPTVSSINKVESVHWYMKDNGRQHHTIQYDQVHDKKNPQPVLRRGQNFYVVLRFKKNDFDINRDRVVLNFIFGPNPSVSKGTLAVLPILSTKFSNSKDEWDVRVDNVSRGGDLILQVFIPPDTPVGVWNLEVRAGLKDRNISKEMITYKHKTDIYILFNPWCRDDDVFMENEEYREEYVMNDNGKVYQGLARNPHAKPWVFGQFDDVVLPVACYLLELARMPHSQRGRAVQVVRAISAGINSNDDNGILIGNWSNDYSDGTHPGAWTGSVKILEEYVKSRFRPVSYGQCWVFSGICTTICRALGIPCRSVTNFNSAHDTDSSITIEMFFDKEGNKLKCPYSRFTDSIWNYHVWNDVWMTRPDLPPGYGGWQAIDATPQELSNNKFQCGPASLEAIRRGDVGFNYDAPFVFSEVNADVFHWVQDDDAEWGYSRHKSKISEAGTRVVTKKPGVDDIYGDRDMQDATTEYKSTEGSKAERLAVYNAVSGSRRARYLYGYNHTRDGDVAFDLTEIESIAIGEPYKIKLTFRNESTEIRTVIAAITTRSVDYTGVSHSLIKKAEKKILMRPRTTQELVLTVEFNEYWQHLVDQCLINIYAMCRVEETGQTWTDQDDFEVTKPRLHIDVPKEVSRGKDSKVVFSFTNPLNQDLTNCQICIDGSGLVKPKYLPVQGSVKANGRFTYNFRFRPRIHGNRKFVVSFNSEELNDVNGVCAVKVAK